MTPNSFFKLLRSVERRRSGLCLAFLVVASLRGGVMFTDGTFNLTDYSIVTWKSVPSVSITVGQTQTGGNPGQALQIFYTFPGGSGSSMVGLTRPSFAYNPATQGPIQAIDFNVEKYVTFTGCSSCQVDLTNTARMLILQNGMYYMTVVPLPGAAGTFLRASATGLRASDFGLFDFNTGSFNPAVNPSFSSGAMQFGVAVRYQFVFDQFATAEVRLDNLSINVQPAQPGPAITAIGLPVPNISRLAPGAPITITGTNLGTGASDAATILVGGRPAPVTDFTSSTSLVAQVPVDAPVGPTTVTATYKGQSSAPFNVTVDAFSPAILAPVFDSADAPITSARTAAPNTQVYLIAFGLGPTNPPMVTGVKAAALAPATTPVQVTVGGKMVQPDYAGRLVGTVGSYKVSFKVPADLTVGDQPVFITVGGRQSNSITLTVGAPGVTITSIVNAATFKSKGAAPNSFASIFFANFATQDSAPNIFPATMFNGLSVLFNGVEAPLYFVSGKQGQINLVLPSELPENGLVNVQVKTPLGATPAFMLQMASTDLGLFRIPDPSKPTRNNGAVLISNTQARVMPAAMAAAYGFPSCEGATPATVCAQPAAVGDAIQIYLTGAGKATPDGDPAGKPLATGMVAPVSGIPLYRTVQMPAVTIGGVPATVGFSGITPGNAGLYQINVVIPDGVKPDDDVPVVVTMPTGNTDTVTIAVRSS